MSLLRHISYSEPCYSTQQKEKEVLSNVTSSGKEFHTFILLSVGENIFIFLNSSLSGFIGFCVVLVNNNNKGQKHPFLLFCLIFICLWSLRLTCLFYKINYFTSSIYVGMFLFFLLLSEYLFFPLH